MNKQRTTGQYIVLILFFVLPVACQPPDQSPMVTTFAGNGVMGLADGVGQEASFANLMAIATDSAGNIYVADSHNNLIRKITAGGRVTTLAGSGKAGAEDGSTATCSFFYPAGIAVDRKGNIYVSDTHNSLIRKIGLSGIVTTIAGLRAGQLQASSSQAAERFDNPAGIAVDDSGYVYVADWANDLIRKISPDGKVSDFAGRRGSRGARDGQGTEASFYLPWGIALDSQRNLYVCDSYNNMIRKVSPQGKVTTIAGNPTKGAKDGLGKAASFLHPAGIAVDRAGNLLVADAGNHRIRKISPDGMVSTFAGNGSRGREDGHSARASFNRPYGLAIDKLGVIYVADYLNNMVRKINP